MRTNLSKTIVAFILFWALQAAGAAQGFEGEFYIRDMTPGNFPGIPEGTLNLVVNPSFETGAAWVVDPSTTGSVSLKNDGGMEGDRYIRLINSDLEHYCKLTQSVDLLTHKIQPGTRIMLSGAVRLLPTGYYCQKWMWSGSVTLEVHWMSGSGQALEKRTKASGTLNEWTMIAGSFTVPETAVTAKICLVVQGKPEIELSGTQQYSLESAYAADFDAIGFYVQPAVTPLTLIGPNRWSSAGLDLEVVVDSVASIDDGVRIVGYVENKLQASRAFDLGYVELMPPSPPGVPIVWHEGFTSSLETGDDLYYTAEPIDLQSNWPVLSYYPFSALELNGHVYSLGTPLDTPRVCHTAYYGAEKAHMIEFHLGLLSTEEDGYSDFKFAIDTVDITSPWGFRAAAKSYLDRYGDQIQPLDMAEMGGFGHPADPHWGEYMEALGVRYFQTQNPVWVDEYGDTFIAMLYTCPWMQRFTYTDPLEPDFPFDFDTIMGFYDYEWIVTYDDPNDWFDQMIRGMNNSIMHTHMGDRFLTHHLQMKEINSVVYPIYSVSINLNPDVPPPQGSLWTMNGATAMMNAVDAMYDTPVINKFAGIEADLYMNNNRFLDYKKENLNCSNEFGLVYGLGTLAPAAWGGLSNVLYVKALRKHLKDNYPADQGQILAGNVQIHGFGHYAMAMPYLDVAGFESNAVRYFDYNGSPEEHCFRRFIMNQRCMCRLYCPLTPTWYYYELFPYDLNNMKLVFDELTALVAFYGFYPTIHHIYSYLYPNLPLDDPEWIEELVNVIVPYIPILDDLNAAGWEPITLAHTSDNTVGAERFGPFEEGGDVYFTLLNNPNHITQNEEAYDFNGFQWPETPPKDITFSIDSLNKLGLTGNLYLRERVKGAVFFPDHPAYGTGEFFAARDEDQLEIGGVLYPGDTFRIPPRALRTFMISSSLVVDNEVVNPTQEEDTPYFGLSGTNWQYWADLELDAVYVTSALNCPKAQYEWTVSEPGIYDVEAIWPDLRPVLGIPLADARYRVLLDGEQVGLPWSIDQNDHPDTYQKVGGVNIGEGVHTVTLEVTYAQPGGALVVDTARLMKTN